MSAYQFCERTFKTTIQGTGVGIHSGAPATITLTPAEVGTGLVFRRTDITDKNNVIPADYLHVADTKLCSCFANEAGVSVSTAEHLMGALNAYGITNAFIDINGPEIPIMDGSAADFIDLFEKAGIEEQNAPQKALKIKKEVTFTDDKGISVSIRPADKDFTVEFEIDFAAKIIGHQAMTFTMSLDNFKKQISFARTFGQMQEVQMLHAMGLGRGGNLDNTVIVDADKVLNPNGLRDELEFVRHKILDTVGDLYQAGMPIIGYFKGCKSGHYHNNMILREVFKDPDNYEIIDLNQVA